MQAKSMIYRHYISGVLVLWLGFCFTGTFLKGCGESPPEPEIVEFSDEESEEIIARIKDETSVSHPEEFEVNLWASEEMIGDPVAIDIDPYGRMYVAVTSRRRSSMFDIRNHPDWMAESLSWETVEERREFIYRELAPERSEQNTWLPDFNEDGSHDWRDLIVEKEEIFILEDLTGNGTANRSQLFLRDFHEVDSDIIGTVLYDEGSVFAGIAPDVWRLKDQSGNGIADQKESISYGYGVHISFGGHGVSGLRKGPDGRIYWSIGDIGISVEDQEGNRWHYPHEGTILRSEPDGSNFEVYASGLRNTHEFDFDKYGNLITVDNDGDHPGEFERLVYLIDGSDSGWRINWQFGKYNQPDNNAYKVWMDEEYYKPRFDNQSALILPPLARYHSGPAGLVYNPGTALNSEWENYFFMAGFRGSPATSTVYAFSLSPSGASFELENDREILEGVLATGLSFGPDGALYVADWVQGWDTEETGRIWKLDVKESNGEDRRSETQRLLRQSFDEKRSEDLIELLGYKDMRIRQKAQFKLVDRENRDALELVIAESDQQLARIHGIWGLAQLGRSRPDMVEPLLIYLQDEDSEIRAQTARMLGDVRYEPAAEHLIPLLEDEHPRVRHFAAEALGRIGWQEANEPIVEMLRANDDEDVYLRHAGAIALSRIGDVEFLARLSVDTSKAVRVAALFALNRLDRPEVARFLSDEDELIVTDAARAINDDDFIEDALPELAAILEQNSYSNEALVRRGINANLYVGDAAAANRLAQFSLQTDIRDELRVEAIQTLSGWTKSSPYDRVSGRYRGVIENDLQDASDAIVQVVDSLLDDENSDIRLAVLALVGNLEYSGAHDQIAEMISLDPSGNVRMEALNVLLSIGYDSPEELFAVALEDPSTAVRLNALGSIQELQIPPVEVVELISVVLEEGTTDEMQGAYQILGNLDHPDAHDMMTYYMQELINGDLPPEVHLDLLLAAEASDSNMLHELLQEYEQGKNPDDSVSVYAESLHGGDAARGERIFYQDVSAQCMRCHAVAGEGGDAGPDLSDVGARSTRDQLLRSLVEPSANVTPGYGVVTIVLEDGETVRGVLLEESDSEITLRSGNTQQTIPKDQIESRTDSPSSMPPMGDLLTRSQLRDLVEFMTTLEINE